MSWAYTIRPAIKPYRLSITIARSFHIVKTSLTFSLVLPNLFLIFCLFCPSKAPTPTTPPQIQIFNSSLHPEFGNLRTLTIEGEPWFVGKDVAEALGYFNTSKAIRNHVSEDDKMGVQNVTPSITDSLGRTQYPVWINESGLYSLILGSKLEKAKEFKRWVTAEVLPTIRKTGGYIKGCFFSVHHRSLTSPWRRISW